MRRLVWLAALLLLPTCTWAQALPAAPTPSIGAGAGTQQGAACDAAEEQATKSIQAQAFTQAITAARQAVANCADKSAPLLLLARAQMLSGSLAEAVATAQQLLAADPANLAALILLGQAQYLHGDTAAAAGAFTRAIAAAPGSPEPHYWFARMLYQEGSVPQAITHLQAALRLAPEDYQALDALGLCYEATGKDALAQESFMKALALVYRAHPTYDTVYADYAELLLHQGQTAEAFNMAAEGAERNPSDPREFLLAARALQQAGDEQRSVDWLLQAVRLAPNDPEPHYLLAQAYRRLGQVAKATAEVSQYKQLAANAPRQRR